MSVVAVTGSSGFVGKNLKSVLERNNHSVIEASKWLSGLNDDRRESLTTESGKNSFAQLLSNNKVEAVVDLTGLTAPRESLRYPLEYLQANIALAHNVLRASKDAGIAKIIIPSSNEVFGPLQGDVTYSENTLPAPVTPYGISKLACEHLALSSIDSQNQEVVIVRTGNLFGPLQQTERLIPTVVRLIAKGERPDISNHASSIHDWLYVEDFCRAISAALSHVTVSAVYQVSAGHSYSVSSIAQFVESVLTGAVEVARESETTTIDDSTFRVATGWEPIYGLKEAIEHTVKSIQI